MASNNFALRFKMLGDASGLTKATRKGSKDLGALGKASNKLSGVLKGAFVGFSIAGVTSQLFDFAKAASEDVQGSRLLAQSLANNVKGGEKFSAQVEDQISKLSVMAAVTDDQIRPAFAYLVRSTKSVGKSSKLMSVALDLAAGSGVSVEAAASALGRAYNGNLTALNKLVPGVKKLKDPLGEVEKRFKGMAKIQGDNDPFAQMTILADEAKEEIGKVLLPEIKKFAKYLQSPQGSKLIKEVTSSIKDLVKEGLKLGKWVMDNKEAFIVFGGVLAGLKVSSMAINGYKTLKTIWEGLAKASKLIKAPETGGVGLPQGPVAPGGNKPVVVGKPTTPTTTATGSKTPFALSPAVTVAAAGAAIVALKAQGYSGKDAPRTILADIRRAQDEYGKYFSPTEFLIAAGKKNVSPLGSTPGNMSTVTSKDVYNIKIEGAKLTGEQIVALLKRYNQKRGKPGAFVDLG